MRLPEVRLIEHGQRWGTLAAGVGNTPLIRLERVLPPNSADLFVKLEFVNPSGSVKDRLVVAAIEDAVARGKLKPGGLLVEASVGNTGISLAMFGAAMGYPVVIVMPADVPEEARRRVTAYGATVSSSPPAQGMPGAATLAQRLAEERGGLWLDQFGNSAGVRAHDEGTGAEILEALGTRRIDAFVAGVGTAATLVGVAAALSRKDMLTRIIAVEPARSPVLSGGDASPHRIAGLGAWFVPPLLRLDIISRIIGVDDNDALTMAELLATKEGLLVGPSSGANVAAAMQVGQELGPGHTVVTVLPDSGDRYL